MGNTSCINTKASLTNLNFDGENSDANHFEDLNEKYLLYLKRSSELKGFHTLSLEIKTHMGRKPSLNSFRRFPSFDQQITKPVSSTE